MNRLRALLCSALLVLTMSVGLAPAAEAGTSPVAGKYLSYAYLAVSRSGPAVFVNALVHQDSPTGVVGSPNRTVYLQRQLTGQWQNVLARQTDPRGVFAVGYLSAPSYSYRLVVVAGSSTWGTTSGTATSPALGGVLLPGHTLTTAHTDGLYSPSGEFRLEVQESGMFGLVQHSVFRDVNTTIEAPVLEITGLPSPPVGDHSRLTMLGTGDLVLISAAGKPLWSSHTSGAGNALYVQNDGNLVIYNKASHAFWSSGTTRVMLLSGGTIPSGASYVSKAFAQFGPHNVGRLTMQRDGNLVLLGGGQLIWSSNTHVAGSHAAFTTNGTLAIYSPGGTLLWHSASYGLHSTVQVMCGQLLFTPSNHQGVYWPSFLAPKSCSG